MSESEARLFRVEIERPKAAADCYPCVATEALTELIIRDEPAGTVVRVYDYDSWTPGSERSLIRALTFVA